MDWRWISPTTITTTLLSSSTSTKKYCYHKINNYIIILIIYTILLTSIGCSPTRKPVHNFQIENIEPHKRDELKVSCNLKRVLFYSLSFYYPFSC